MKIIYPSTNEDGEAILAQLTPAPKFLAQLTGTDEEKLIHIANKDLPTGTKYEILMQIYQTEVFVMLGGTQQVTLNALLMI